MASIKRVLIITPKKHTGGAERVAAYLSRLLSDRAKVNVISFYDADKEDYKYFGDISELNLSLRGSLYNRAVSFLKSVFYVARFKKKHDIDISISFIGNPNTVNLITSKYSVCIPSVRTYIRKPNSRIKRILQKVKIKFLYKRADTIVAVSHGVKNDLVDYYNIEEQKIKVIYPFHDIAYIRKKMLEQINESIMAIFKKPVIITVGRLAYDKGQWQLIRAFDIVKEHNPDVNLVILGRGDLETELKKVANLSPYHEDIHFIGHKSNPYKYINQSTVFVFPSLIEGFGNAAIEAMACGKAIVASDCDVGPREIIAGADSRYKAKDIEFHDAGVLVPVGKGDFSKNKEKLTEEEEMLAAALVRLLKDEKRRKSIEKSALERARMFDKKIISKQWLDLVNAH